MELGPSIGCSRITCLGGLKVAVHGRAVAVAETSTALQERNAEGAEEGRRPLELPSSLFNTPPHAPRMAGKFLFPPHL